MFSTLHRFLIIGYVGATSIAVGAEPADGTVMTESVLQMSHAVGEHQLRYLLQVPQGEKPKAGWPLILFLHGYGESGDDIAKLKVHGPPKLIAKFKQLQKCVIISPQCPQQSWWRIDALKSLVDEVVASRGDIDTSRLYLTGLSMGGYGTWSFLSLHPDYFAAAIPICGGGDPFRILKGEDRLGVKNEFDLEGMKQAKDVPIWAFHGTDDTSVPIVETEILVDLLKELGSENLKFTVIKGADHGESWRHAYGDTKTWQWLFAQQRAR